MGHEKVSGRKLCICYFCFLLWIFSYIIQLSTSTFVRSLLPIQLELWKHEKLSNFKNNYQSSEPVLFLYLLVLSLSTYTMSQESKLWVSLIQNEWNLLSTFFCLYILLSNEKSIIFHFPSFIEKRQYFVRRSSSVRRKGDKMGRWNWTSEFWIIRGEK